MDGSLLGSLISSGVVASGGIAGIVTRRFAQRREEIKELKQTLAAKEAVLEAKDEAITELRSQRDELKITANLLERFLNQLPPKGHGD